MKLHDNIYYLRTEKKLSQGELAALLDVSRQSVSKWETGTSVPELEKLIRMKDIFGVTLEALVGTQETAVPARPAPSAPATAVIREILPIRKILGALCFCLAFTAFFAGGAMPSAWADAAVYASMGLVCFLIKKRVPLYAAWIVFVGACGKLWLEKGVRISDIFDTARYHSTLRNTVSWLLLALYVLLLAASVYGFWGVDTSRSHKLVGRLLLMDSAFLVLLAASGIGLSVYFARRIAALTGDGDMTWQVYTEVQSLFRLSSAIGFVLYALAMAAIAVLAVLITLFARSLWRRRREEHDEAM
ncbi:MAG: helix-turn-helix transcriptional regulator [Clostridia bacterium]|nr:helix-turn-helix transcriptional regulator [Clostridia bacterium]